LHDAEDVTQDVMIRASSASFDARSSVEVSSGATVASCLTRSTLCRARGRVTDIISFHDPALFPAFGLG
jgi:hypothetical protein